VYGLAAAVDHPDAVNAIFSLKGRPANNPLIIHLESSEHIQRYTDHLPDDFFALGNAFWPGPLTVVVPVNQETIPAAIRAGLPTAAFRVPSHPLTRSLLKKTGPLVMPSANLSGTPSATSPDHVEHDFGSAFPVLDGGECNKGVESTILLWREGRWIVVRLGALAPQDFVPVLGYCPEVEVSTKGTQEAPLCPGQLYRHYAPKAKLHLMHKMASGATGNVIGFADRNYPETCRLFSLGDSKSPEAPAHRLYAILRQLDQEGIEEAWVDIDFPEDGLWMTLRERLFKASKK
jgi:L-threonylcarbamoyladenylate synthase